MRRRLGLRSRLILFYGFTALAPVGIAGFLLLTYLHRQIDHSLQRFQQSLRQQIEDYNATTESATRTIIQQSLEGVLPKLEQQIQEDHAKANAQQQSALQKTIHQFEQSLTEELAHLTQATEQTQQATLDKVSSSTEQVQNRSLADLTQQAEATTREALTSLINTQMATLANSLSRQVDSVLRNYLAQLTLIAQQPAIQSAVAQLSPLAENEEAESRWVLQSLQNREPAYFLLALLNREGKFRLTLCDEELDMGIVIRTAEPLWNALESDDSARVGDPLTLRTGTQESLFIPILVPVRQRGTHIVGAVFALVALDELNTLVRTFRLGQHGYAFIATKEGTILAHPNRSLVGKQETALLPPNLVRTPLTREVETPTGNQIVASAGLPSLDAFLLLVQPSSEAFQLVNDIQVGLKQAYDQQKHQTQQAIAQIRQSAGAELTQRLAERQRQITHTLEQAKRNTLQQANSALTELSQKQRTELSELIRTTLSHIPFALQEALQSMRATVFQRTSDQFALTAQQIASHIQNQILNAFAIVLVGVMSFLSMGGVYLHRTLVRPLKAIISTSHEIAQGDLHKRVRLPYGGCPDLNDLAHSFNHMVDSLRKMETQLVQSSKLASLGTLASGVAHELNQPLAIIRALAQQNLEVLERQGHALSDNEIENLREDLRIVERQTSRMSQIILHLRAFARKPSAEQVPVNLNEVVQNALILLREQLRQRGIELDEQYEPNLPPVLGDPNGLEQIVINLLTNARDALENVPNARLTLATQTQTTTEGTWVELHVQDNGPGVPEDIRSQIFDPFFTTKDPNKGTGLGLAISLEIAQKHGGTLSLEESTEGAHFILRLPAGNEARQAA